MAKHKSPQDLMAARNPFARKPVAPVDIYKPPIQVEAEKPDSTQELTNSNAKNEQSTSKEPTTKTAASKKDGVLRSYSTYLHPGQIKGIKLRAVEQDVDDYAIVQEAIDEYFQKHPL